MTDQDVFQRIIEFENTFPKDFSDFIETEYGYLFFNEKNPDSYDCNHAIILNYDINLKSCLNKIMDFYEEKNLVPRIYTAFLDHKEEKNLFPLLEKNHFIIEENKARLYLLQNKPKEFPPPRLKIKRIRRMSSEIEDMISQEDGGDWNSRKLKRHLHRNDVTLYAAKDKCNRIVSLATINIQDKIARVDDVLTRSEKRRLGYATEMISGLARIYTEKHSQPLYLFTDNPFAEKAYTKGGFVKQDFPHKLWTAYKVEPVTEAS